VAQYFTDFNNNPLGGIDVYPAIAEWTPRVWYSIVGWNIIQDGATRYLAVAINSSRKLATYDNLPDTADVELYAKIRLVSGDVPSSFFLAARADKAKNSSNTDSDTHFYYAGVGDNVLEIAKYVNGTETVITSLALAALPTTGDLCVRFSVIGSALSVKAWADVDPEPAGWGLTATDTDIPEAGAVGICMNAFTGTVHNYIEYAVGTGASSAPTAPVPIDFLELRCAETKTSFVTSGTSLTVSIDPRIQAGDLILVPYYARATINPPAGYTKSGDVIYGIASQRSGVMWKIADGSEAGTSLTLTQSAAARMEALVLAYKTAVDFTFADTVSSTGTATTTSLTQTTANRALSIVFAVNAYAGGNQFVFSMQSASDAVYFLVNTDKHPNTDSNRLQVYSGVYFAPDTQYIEFSIVSTRSWIVTMVNFTEVAGSLVPTLSTVFASSITEFSAVPNVTITV